MSTTKKAAKTSTNGRSRTSSSSAKGTHAAGKTTTRVPVLSWHLSILDALTVTEAKNLPVGVFKLETDVTKEGRPDRRYVEQPEMTAEFVEALSSEKGIDQNALRDSLNDARLAVLSFGTDVEAQNGGEPITVSIEVRLDPEHVFMQPERFARAVEALETGDLSDFPELVRDAVTEAPAQPARNGEAPPARTGLRF